MMLASRPDRLLPLKILVMLMPAVLAAQSGAAQKAPASAREVLYASVGGALTQYDIDAGAAALVKRGSVQLPANVQEAWPHPSRKFLYVAWSNGGASYGSGAAKNNNHGISAFRIDPASGALTLHGQPAALPWRPVFTTTDIDGTHILAAYPEPSGLTVYRIMPDGTVGAQVQPSGPLDFGIYGHQVRMDPSNKTVILVTRGNGPTTKKAEDPGAIKIFSYHDGVLANLLSIAPDGGFGYQVRHLDFHPSGKWVYVTLERQNKVHVYRRMADGTLDPTPLFVKDSVADAANIHPGQAPSSIHVHPNGRFVYVANRATGTVEFEGKRVFAGGENTIAVFAINQETGEPTLIQSADTHGFNPRTFALDPSGRLLVVANQTPASVRDGAGLKTVPARLAVFRVRDDGKLDFANQYDVETTPSSSMFWAGIVGLP